MRWCIAHGICYSRGLEQVLPFSLGLSLHTCEMARSPETNWGSARFSGRVVASIPFTALVHFELMILVSTCLF